MIYSGIAFGGVTRTIIVGDAVGEGWHVSVIPADRPQVQDLWFACRDCALAFADGMAAASTWRVIDESTCRSFKVESAKADAQAQLDLFITNSRSP